MQAIQRSTSYRIRDLLSGLMIAILFVGIVFVSSWGAVAFTLTNRLAAPEIWVVSMYVAVSYIVLSRHSYFYGSFSCSIAAGIIAGLLMFNINGIMLRDSLSENSGNKTNLWIIVATLLIGGVISGMGIFKKSH